MDNTITWTRKGKRELGIWRGHVRFQIIPNVNAEEDAPLAGGELFPFVLRESLPTRMLTRHTSIEDAKKHAARRVTKIDPQL